jgi:tRNA dimethylallyltransferase
MKEIKSRILVVSGPTASGKSDIAIRLARKFNGEIISADSRQVYRGMDIGTGKVKRGRPKVRGASKRAGEQEPRTSPVQLFLASGIRHHLLDIASPTRQYSVARFKRDATRAIRDILRRGKLPIICGGTGFWIDALVYDQSLPDVKPNLALRNTLSKLSVIEPPPKARPSPRFCNRPTQSRSPHPCVGDCTRYG